MPPVLSKLPFMISDEDVIDKRYENCVIYKLVHKEDEDAYEKYVGHTIQSLTRRMLEHRNCCSNENRHGHNFKLYKYIRENGGIDMWEIVKIIDYPCKNDIEAGKKEGEYIISLKCSLNTQLAGRDKNQYYYDNKEENNRKDRERWLIRREELLTRQKERIICDNCGGETTRGNLARHKKSKKCLEHNAN